MAEIIKPILFMLPFFILVPKFLSPLKPLRCFYGLHKFKHSSTKKGYNMSVKKQKDGELELVSRDADLYRCVGCGEYLRKQGGLSDTSSKEIK